MSDWKVKALELRGSMGSRGIAKIVGKSKSTINYFFNDYDESLSNKGSTPEDDKLSDSELEGLAKCDDSIVSNLAKRLRTAQKTNTQLRRVQNNLFDGEKLSQLHIKSIQDSIKSIQVCKSPVFSISNNNKKLPNSTIEILFSDLQIGKVGENYNTSKSIEAMKEYGEELIKYIHSKSKEYNIERVIFASLGDIVEDHMKHGVQSATSTDSGLSEQMSNAIKYIWKYILNPVFSLGIKTDVMCVAGNHGSSQHKGMDMFKAGLFSYDYTIYNSLKLITEQAKFNHVNFIIPEGVFGYLNIYGNYSVYEHGYFNNANEKSMSDQMKKRGQQIKKHVEYFRCGDMHHTCSYDTHRMILNGAFFGVDEGGTEYSGILGFNSIPSQVVVLHTPEERLGRTTAKELHLIQLS